MTGHFPENVNAPSAAFHNLHEHAMILRALAAGPYFSSLCKILGVALEVENLF